jgi:hypothetical protein
MKRYIVFAWMDHEQSGGYNDRIPRSWGNSGNLPTSWDTLEEARAAKESWFARYGEYSSFQIVDVLKDEVVESGHVKERL